MRPTLSGWLASLIIGLMAPRPSAYSQVAATDFAFDERSSEELKAQRDGLWEAARSLLHGGDLAAAAATGETILTIERQRLTEGDAGIVASLEWLADVYEQAEDWNAALARRGEALAWREAHQGTSHWKTIDARLALAHVPVLQGLSADDRRQLGTTEATDLHALKLHGQGRYVEALALVEENLAIRRRVLGEQHRDTAMSLNDLGGLLHSMGDHAGARPYYEEALTLRRQVLGDEHPVTAKSLNNLGSLLHTMADYAGARPYYEQSLAIRRKVLGEHHPDTAMSLSGLGVLLHAMGDYAGARPCLDQALAIRREVLGKEHLDTARSLGNLGSLLQTMGDYAGARPCYEEVLAIRRKVLGPEHPDTARSLRNLGLLLKSTADYAGARPYLEQALVLHRKVLGEEHPDTAVSLNNLGGLLDSMADNAGAKPYYEQALAIRRKVLGEEHPDTATSLNNLGGLLHEMGDYAGARPYYEQALVIRRKVLGAEHPLTAASLSNWGSLLDSMGDVSGALPYYKQALAIVVEQIEASAIAQNEAGQRAMSRSVQAYLDSYLSLCLRSGDQSGAEAYRAVLNWKGATLVRQRAARMVAENENLAPLFAELQGVTRKWSALSAALPQADPRWGERLAALVEEKDRLELALSRQSAEFRTATGRVEIADLQAALPDGSALVDYFEFSFREPSAETPGQFDWRQSLAAFVIRTDGEVQMFDLGAMEPIAQAIDVWRRGHGLGADAETAGRLLREKLWTPLAAAIGDAELVLVSPDGALGKLPFAALPGARAGSYLIEDVALALVPAPRLIPAMAAGADRRELPRELLVLGGVDYDRSAASDPHALAVAAPRKRPWNRGAAAQQEEIVGSMEWLFLPGSDSEASYIAGLYQRLMDLPSDSEQVVHLRGAGATEEAFRQFAGECYLLHLATHGFFAAEDKKSALDFDEVERAAMRDNPFGDRLSAVRGYSPGLLSGLVLAGANVPLTIPDDPEQLSAVPDDGHLTADEIAFMSLAGARLIVMSACESGLGETAGGEGLLGIQRAFQVAGARTTIATLWKVNDEATRRIMEEFYRNYLEREMSPRDALRAAQLWALNNPNLVPRGSDPPPDQAGQSRLPPQFWAAFTLSGDWR